MENEAQNNIMISVNLNGKDQEIEVKQEDSSDGAPFYYCDINGKRLTQIRKDEHDHWEQLWGDLDDASVTRIGEAIESSNSFQN